jgi:hypothetical protein
MSLEILSRADFAEPADAESESDLDRPWVENVVAAAATVLTVVLVSSFAVLMYLA